jgi:hypothetical protein
MENQMAEKLETFKFVGSLNAQVITAHGWIVKKYLDSVQFLGNMKAIKHVQGRYSSALASERGDVPGWVLVVLMTTGLVTAIWTIAAPRLTSILKNSLDAMNGIR